MGVNKNSPSQLLSTVKSWPFFSNFSEDIILALEPFMKFKSLPKGSIVLEEGQMNTRLFFLRSGQVEIVVDGESVASLLRPGDIIGEMSIISSRPVSAQVVATSNLDFAVLDFEEISKLPHELSSKIYMQTYRYFSEVLSEKLFFTNMKAKRFETANRSLENARKLLVEYNSQLEEKVASRTKALSESHQELEQQNAAMTTSLHKLREFAQTKDQIFNLLRTLSTKILQPLQQNIVDLKVNTEPISQATHQLALRQIVEGCTMLENLAQQYSHEAAIKNKKVLVIDANKKQQLITKMALGGTGADLDLAADAASAFEKLGEKNHDIVFIDSSLLELADQIAKSRPELKMVLVTSDETHKHVAALRKHESFETIVSRSEEDRTFTTKTILTTLNKLVNKDIFGIEKYIGWGTEIIEKPIVTSEARSTLLDSMESYFGRLGVRKSIIERCRSVGEELLMNAIYDAPINAEGKSIYNHLPRTVVVQLKPEEQGCFQYGCDGLFAAISVSDPFGALRRQTLYDYLLSCYEGRAGEFNAHKGGAGRGLFQLVQTSDLVVFNVKEGIKTEVIALFNIDMNASKSANPTFHLFYNPKTAGF